MKKEKLENEIMNWRQLNAAKAREGRSLKAREKKNQEINDKLNNLSVEIDKKVDREIEKKISNMLEEQDFKKLKSAFYQAFHDVGGVRGLVKWIKEHDNNKKEYYKLFASLLRSDSQKTHQQEQPPSVVFNIITPKGEENITIDAEYR